MFKKILMLALIAAPLQLCAQKFAHFDYATIMQAMPEYKAVTAELETIGKQYQAELEGMQKEFPTKMEKYQKEDTEATPQNIRDRHQQELQDMYQRLQQASQDNQEAFEKARQTKMQPVSQKLIDAAQAVAKEGGYVYIIDSQAAQAGGILINETLSTEVTAQIMKKLGLSATTATPSAATK